MWQVEEFQDIFFGGQVITLRIQGWKTSPWGI